MNKSNTRPKIYLVGTGITFNKHLTPEAKECLEDSDIVYHLTAYHEDLKGLCKRVVNLKDTYFSSCDGSAYQEIANIVVQSAIENGSVAFATYGHPLVLVDSCQMILEVAREVEIDVKVVSAISSIDILLEYLQLDVGLAGLQIYEVNKMVLYDCHPNPFISCFILQVNAYGEVNLVQDRINTSARFNGLQEFLSHTYSQDHPCVLITCPFTKDMEPIIYRTTIAELGSYFRGIHTGMSLYIPPRKPEKVNKAFEMQLELSSSFDNT